MSKIFHEIPESMSYYVSRFANPHGWDAAIEAVVRMKEEMVKNTKQKQIVFSPEVIVSLKKAIEDAEKFIEELREARKVDPKILHKLMDAGYRASLNKMR